MASRGYRIKLPNDKSNNVETSLLSPRGRITRGSFLLRLLVCVAVWLVFHLVFVLWEATGYKHRAGLDVATENIHRAMRRADRLVLPAALLLFLAVQGAKRMHDNDRSAWWLLVPFYGLWLLFATGTPDDNSFGLLPRRERTLPAYAEPDGGGRESGVEPAWQIVAGSLAGLAVVMAIAWYFPIGGNSALRTAEPMPQAMAPHPAEPAAEPVADAKPDRKPSATTKPGHVMVDFSEGTSSTWHMVGDRVTLTAKDEEGNVLSGEWKYNPYVMQSDGMRIYNPLTVYAIEPGTHEVTFLPRDKGKGSVTVRFRAR